MNMMVIMVYELLWWWKLSKCTCFIRELEEDIPILACIIFTLNWLTLTPKNIREDAYSRTGGIFRWETARDTAYSLWFNEA